jgi:hypothetical protein
MPGARIDDGSGEPMDRRETTVSVLRNLPQITVLF